MKFENYLKTINQVEIYPIISLVLFLSVFIGVVFYIYSLKKSEIEERANIPMDWPFKKQIR